MTLTSTLTVVVGRPSPPPSGPQTDRHVSLSPATLRTLSLGTASRVVLALRPAHPTPADPRHAQLQRWFLALPDSRAACLILVLVLAMDVELLAWIPLVGEKLNSITLIIVVLSIGLVVDFSAHIAHAFLLSGRPTRSEKAAQAVAELGRPLLSGGFSTFLGVCLLAFASAPANRTFFYMLSGVVLVGVINGLVLLPALLTLVGPKTTPSGKSAN